MNQDITTSEQVNDGFDVRRPAKRAIHGVTRRTLVASDGVSTMTFT